MTEERGRKEGREKVAKEVIKKEDRNERQFD